VFEDLAGVGIGGDLVGREVAEVLVDPVRRQRRPHPVAPPRLLAHLGAPHGRGVPVVAHVVVVEDHCDGHRGQQPPHLGVGPGVAVHADVLVEAHDLVVGPFGVPVAAPGDAAPGAGRELIGVDLVAEQQQRVGPLLGRAARQLGGRDVEGVEAQARREARLVRLRVAARAEQDAVAPVGGLPAGADHAGRVRVGGKRPGLLAVDLDGVGRARPRREPGDRHERVVLARYLERSDLRVEHADPRRIGRLHPHLGGRLPDMTQDRPEHE
jgi:hypothetical protein